jgi:ubiquinol-cytochrome c reductase cytochrome c subunit
MKRLLRWWFTRPARLPRGLRLTAAVIMGALALVGLATPSGSAQVSGAASHPSNGPGGPPGVPNPPSKATIAPAPGDLTKSFPSSPQLQAEGYNLYNERCSSCHGLNLEGVPGVAPNLRQAGAGPLDFYLSTGRMPLAFPRDEPLRQKPVFNRHQIDAIIAYVTKFGGPPAPAVHPSEGNLSEGRHQFTLHCAGCHQQVGRGGMFVGAFVPDLLRATGQQVAEAVRMGPYFMPHFDDHQIDQDELNSLARYVLWTQHPNNAGGWAIYNIGPIPEGLVAWLLGLGALLIVARLIGERTDERTGSATPTSNGG